MASNSKGKEIVETFDVLGAVTWRKTFEMGTDRVEIDILPNRFVPFVKNLSV